MSPQLSAFLMLIRKCEGTADPDGYRALFGYRPGNGKLFTSFDDHPRIYFPYVDKSGKTIRTSAAGAYQITVSTWDPLQRKFGFPDFSPTSQDEAAIALIDEKGGLSAIEQGDLWTSMLLVRNVWASLPTATVPQPHRDLAFAQAAFTASGGVLA